jgi:hypothetical protein
MKTFFVGLLSSRTKPFLPIETWSRVAAACAASFSFFSATILPSCAFLFFVFSASIEETQTHVPKNKTIAESIAENSGGLKDAADDFSRTAREKTGQSEEVIQLKAIRTQNEKLIILYQNAQARRSDRIITSR